MSLASDIENILPGFQTLWVYMECATSYSVHFITFKVLMIY